MNVTCELRDRLTGISVRSERDVGASIAFDAASEVLYFGSPSASNTDLSSQSPGRLYVKGYCFPNRCVCVFAAAVGACVCGCRVYVCMCVCVCVFVCVCLRLPWVCNFLSGCVSAGLCARVRVLGSVHVFVRAYAREARGAASQEEVGARRKWSARGVGDPRGRALC